MALTLSSGYYLMLKISRKLYKLGKIRLELIQKLTFVLCEEIGLSDFSGFMDKIIGQSLFEGAAYLCFENISIDQKLRQIGPNGA